MGSRVSTCDLNRLCPLLAYPRSVAVPLALSAARRCVWHLLPSPDGYSSGQPLTEQTRIS